jgi:hypothetical protein
MKKLILVLILLIFSVGTDGLSFAQAARNLPELDLVQMFANTPDRTVSGVRLTNIMNIKIDSVNRIKNVYNQIYYGSFEPNQIICKTKWFYDEDTSRIVPSVMWSVWYQPGAMVDKNNTECVDSVKKPSTPSSWYRQGYRWLGSGFEAHKDLVWFSQMTTIRPSLKGTWCKAASVSYLETGTGTESWPRFQKAVFQFSSASEDFTTLVSRDVSCTADLATYSRWMRTPGWSYVFLSE